MAPRSCRLGEWCLWPSDSHPQCPVIILLSWSYHCSSPGSISLTITAAGSGQPVQKSTQSVREGVTPPADPPAGPSQTDIVALSLDNALSSSGDNAAVSHIQNSPIPMGEGLSALPRNLLQKIWASDYIDFTELPPAKGSPRSMPHLMEGRVYCSCNGRSWRTIGRQFWISPPRPSAMLYTKSAP